MTGGDLRAEDEGATASPWQGTAPELIIAAVLVAVTAVAGWAMAGWAGLAVVAVATAAIAMVVLRGLLPQLTPDRGKKAREKPTARTLSGSSHRRFVAATATSSQPVRRRAAAGAGAPAGRRLANATTFTSTRIRRRPRLLCPSPRRGPVGVDRPGDQTRDLRTRRRRGAGYPAAHPGAPHQPIGAALERRDGWSRNGGGGRDRPGVHGHPGRARARGRRPPPDAGAGADRHPGLAATSCSKTCPGWARP